MKRSIDRILTPHVGSLSRPPDLQEFLRRIDRVCAHFRDRLGGQFSTLLDLWREVGAAPATAPSARAAV